MSTAAILMILYILTHTRGQETTKVTDMIVSPDVSGSLKLVCEITYIQPDQWVAIFRTHGTYAECLFWDKSTVKSPPYTCTGDFRVSISDRQNLRYYNITLDPGSSAEAGTYFCRVLRKTTDKHGFDEVDKALESKTGFTDGLNTNLFPMCSSNPQNMSYVDGDEVTLTCSPLGVTPVTVQWSRSDGIVIEGYPKTLDLNMAVQVSPNSTVADTENPSGYILFHTALTVALDETIDGVVFTCAMMNTHFNSTNSSETMDTCSIGPFTRIYSTPVNSTNIPTPTPPVDGPFLGLGVWLFAFIISTCVVGLAILIIVILVICLIKSMRTAKYLVRKESQRAFANELQQQPTYDDVPENNGDYSPYPESEFDHDWSQEEKPVYGNTFDYREHGSMDPIYKNDRSDEMLSRV